MQFVLTSGGGFVLGLAVAWVIGRIRLALGHFSVNDPVIDTVISVLTPFAAYLGAEALHVGSILAVVGAGLYAGINDSRNIDAPTRAHAWEVWRMLLFAFNGPVFLLLTLPSAPRISTSAIFCFSASSFIRLWRRCRASTRFSWRDTPWRCRSF